MALGRRADFRLWIKPGGLDQTVDKSIRFSSNVGAVCFAGSAAGAGAASWAAGWAGRNTAARIAPAAATPPATREPTIVPRMNALVDARCSACASAGWPSAVIWPDATYAAPTD